ncbi:TraR/DksA family transcriptional regulator [Teredinibacter franksiae]|uniref:TraR/DksA family transcriptional regulator n=1 Tax=Teredinibacter franksiae TaxID=2761453 RepID=UPI001624EF23|nr:TraR/DksA C4-type zinc finger protein [Teredinibacter franksiae]
MPIDLARYKSLLEKDLEQLSQLDAISKQGADTVELDQSKIGRLSRMDALQQQAMQQEQNRRRELKVKQIHAALKRVHEGDYGWCMDCGEPINMKRLEISPAVEFCTQCADKH